MYEIYGTACILQLHILIWFQQKYNMLLTKVMQEFGNTSKSVLSDVTVSRTKAWLPIKYLEQSLGLPNFSTRAEQYTWLGTV